MLLDCYFFQDIKNNSCVSNKSVIFKSIFEVFAIIAIIIFLVLDIMKYETQHKKVKIKNERQENL